MLALMDQTPEPITADDAEALIARRAADSLRPLADAGEDIRIHVDLAPEIHVPLPAKAVKIMLSVLEAMSEKTPVSVIPHEAEFTTKQAADYLNVSRPFLIGLIEKGEITYRMVGSHRRIRFSALAEYERKSREKQRQAISEMIEEAEKLNLE